MHGEVAMEILVAFISQNVYLVNFLTWQTNILLSR